MCTNREKKKPASNVPAIPEITHLCFRRGTSSDLTVPCRNVRKIVLTCRSTLYEPDDGLIGGACALADFKRGGAAQTHRHSQTLTHSETGRQYLCTHTHTGLRSEAEWVVGGGGCLTKSYNGHGRRMLSADVRVCRSRCCPDENWSTCAMRRFAAAPARHEGRFRGTRTLKQRILRSGAGGVPWYGVVWCDVVVCGRRVRAQACASGVYALENARRGVFSWVCATRRSVRCALSTSRGGARGYTCGLLARAQRRACLYTSCIEHRASGSVCSTQIHSERVGTRSWFIFVCFYLCY